MVKMKRFWRTATLHEQSGSFSILLDSRPMRLPGGPALILPHRGLAEAIAAEWQQAGGDIDGEMDYAEVPLTRIAGTAQIRIAPDPAATVAAIAEYAKTDLLCYRAETPDSLVERQHAAWQPWLDWAASTYGAHLRCTQGTMPVDQPKEAVTALQAAVAALDAFQLAGLAILVPVLGSLVLGFAVQAGRLPVNRAFALSVLDELAQEEFWGADPDSEKRRATNLRDARDAARFIAIARNSD